MYREPFDIRLKELPVKKQSEFKPKGYEVDELSQRYMDVLRAKADEIREKDFREGMVRIEASLSKLVSLAEKILAESNNTAQTEYNEEKDTDFKEE